MGASTTHPVGTTVDAGLPNVEGYFAFGNTISGAWTKAMSGTGPFSATGNGIISLATQYQSFENSAVSIGFSLAKDNPIYGNSTTVQPATYYINIWKRIE